MGNPHLDAAFAMGNAAPIHKFYSTDSWIEGSAVDQLNQLAEMPGVQEIAAFPDLHPGKFGPVGCAVLADRVYPQLIGNDIGCGMSLFKIDVSPRKLRPEKAAERLRSLEGSYVGDVTKLLDDASLPSDLLPASLGTIGGGNHFCELQAIADIVDNKSGFKKDQAYILVHSGSRALGMQIFESVQQSMAYGMEAGSEQLEHYLARHDEAVRWASLNRETIARRAAETLRADFELVVDAPHNIVEIYNGQFLHRKGAAKANLPSVPLAGSRDALSFLLKPTNEVLESLSSLAHGSGRKYDRSSMFGRAGTTKQLREQLVRTSFGGRVVCDDRQLLIEEAPTAYKRPEQVVKDLQEFGLVEVIATFEPIVTFKKAASKDREKPAPRFATQRGRS
jgi:release factor H-coupled RctB family protein